MKYRYLQWVFILLFVVVSSSFAGGWAEVTELPISRLGSVATAVNGKIYIIGGLDSAKNLGGRAPALSKVNIYDTQTNTWHVAANMPTPRIAPKTAVFSNEIYVFAGYDRKGARGARREKKTVEVYDPRTDTWVKKRDMPTLRKGFATAVVDGKIYIIGGRVENKRLDEDIITGLVEVYNPLTNKWEKRADMPTKRTGIDAVVVDGKIYVIGGQNVLRLPGLAERFVTHIEEYNPKTNKWRKLPDMPMFKFWFSTIAVDNEIYTIGGVNNAVSRIDDVDIYNPTVNKWRKIEPIPTPKTTMAVVVNGTIYLLGGYVSNLKFSPVVEAYDTGFRAVTAKDKLSTRWGELKKSQNISRQPSAISYQ